MFIKNECICIILEYILKNFLSFTKIYPLSPSRWVFFSSKKPVFVQSKKLSHNLKHLLTVWTIKKYIKKLKLPVLQKCQMYMVNFLPLSSSRYSPKPLNYQLSVCHHQRKTFFIFFNMFFWIFGVNLDFALLTYLLNNLFKLTYSKYGK